MRVLTLVPVSQVLVYNQAWYNNMRKATQLTPPQDGVRQR